MDPARAEAADDSGWVPLIDVSGWSVADLSRGDTALARSVRRVIRGLDDPNGVLSAFESFASDDPESAGPR
jgi:FXSXX-COOH protein